MKVLRIQRKFLTHIIRQRVHAEIYESQDKQQNIMFNNSTLLFTRSCLYKFTLECICKYSFIVFKLSIVVRIYSLRPEICRYIYILLIMLNKLGIPFFQLYT